MSSKAYTAEGGTNGAAVLTSDTGSGDAFSVASAGTGGTLVYDTTHAAHGTKAIKYASGVTSTSVYTAWTGLSWAAVKFRVNFYVTSLTVTSMLVRGVTSGGAAQRFRATVESDGKFHFRDQANTQIAISTSNVPLNAWVGLRGEITAGASAAWNVRYYTSIDSATPTQTFSGATGDFVAGSFTDVRFGIGANTASVAAFWLDDHAIDDTTSPGAAFLTVNPSGLAVAFAVGGPVVTDGAMTVLPSGLAVPVGLGGPAVADGAMTVHPSGLALPVGIGVPALSDGAMTVAPAGLALPVALGSPALADGSLSVRPAGLAVSLVLGHPAAADGAMSSAAAGLGLSVAVGQPSVTFTSDGQDVAADGVAVPVAVGAPTVVDGSLATGPAGLGLAVAVGSPRLLDGSLTAGPGGLALTIAVGVPSVAFTPGPVARPASMSTDRPSTAAVPRPATVAVARPTSGEV